MFMRTAAALLLALALTAPAQAMRPGGFGTTSRMGGGFGGGGGQEFRRPIPETEIRDAATVLQLCSHPEILKTMNSALSRNHLKVERITRWAKGAGSFGYKFVLAPLTPPPSGIHAGGYFTATMSRAGELEEVTKVVLQK